MKNVMLVLLILCGLGCVQTQTHWKSLEIRKGNHAAKPLALVYNSDVSMRSEWVLTQSCVYNLGDVDQCDWNKLTGWSWAVSNKKKSVMLAWRYDTELEAFRLAPYWHEDGSTNWATAPCGGYSDANNPAMPNIVAQVGETISVEIRQRTNGLVSLTVDTGQGRMYWERIFSDLPKTHREIRPWFGGNEDAPHDMQILFRKP